ncbi:MAG: hypothetical protein Q4P13_11160 [Psychrobacter sp.]|nr:hypothetical protein [Psychrobacter sp.]
MTASRDCRGILCARAGMGRLAEGGIENTGTPSAISARPLGGADTSRRRDWLPL